jgi:multidrug resistance efflux pump
MGRKKDQEVESSEQTVKDLKAANRRLKSDNQRLKAEIATLQEAFTKTAVYLKKDTTNLTVEELIKGATSGSSLDEIKNTNKCDRCGASKVKDFHVENVGRLLVCTECKNRKVIKDGKKKE